jgi:hypothetical protein
VDGERTDYVFRKPRRARERHVLWLPVDLAARRGFLAGAFLLTGGLVFVLVALTSKGESDRNTLGWAAAAAIAGIILLIIVHWVQTRGSKRDESSDIIRINRRKREEMGRSGKIR